MSRKTLTMLTALLVMGFLAVLIILSILGGSDNYTPTTTNGAVIFEEACARCHGHRGLGGETKGPRLAGAGAEVGEIKQQISEGKGRMPRFPNIRDQALDNLAEYVNGL